MDRKISNNAAAQQRINFKVSEKYHQREVRPFFFLSNFFFFSCENSKVTYKVIFSQD